METSELGSEYYDYIDHRSIMLALVASDGLLLLIIIQISTITIIFTLG